MATPVWMVAKLPTRVRSCAFVLGVATGMAGSQLDGTQTGGVANCPRITSPRQIYADISWLKNLPCFAHMLSVNYDHSTGRSGTHLAASTRLLQAHDTEPYNTVLKPVSWVIKAKCKVEQVHPGSTCHPGLAHGVRAATPHRMHCTA
jgi:hypothetical protein